MPNKDDWMRVVMEQIQARNIYIQQPRRPAQIDPYQLWQAPRVHADWIIIDDILPAPPPVPVVNDIPTKNFIDNLREDYPTLHLAGSRWFHHRAIQEGLGPDYIALSPETDYDLFIEDSINGREWLKNEGFHSLGFFDNYLDEFTTDIWINDLFPQIQITTRERADAYKWAIENIPLVAYKHYGWKSGPLKPEKKDIAKLFQDWTNEGIEVLEEMNF